MSESFPKESPVRSPSHVLLHYSVQVLFAICQPNRPKHSEQLLGFDAGANEGPSWIATSAHTRYF